MTKDYIKYHQRTYAQMVRDNGFQSPKQWALELRLLAMLMKEHGQKPNEIHANLLGFCKAQYPQTPERHWLVAISKAVKFSQKKGNVLVECPRIDMYLSEIDFVDKQNLSDGAKRVLFAIMIQKKLDKYCYELRRQTPYIIFTYANNERMRRLKKVAKLPKGYAVADGLRELMAQGLIEIMHCKGSPFKLNFVEKFAFSGSLAVGIVDYEQLGVYWDWIHCNSMAGVCVTCWGVYNSRAQNRCYCEKHQGYQKLGVLSHEVVCCDCGAVFDADVKNTRAVRCRVCQEVKVREDARKRKQKERMNKRHETI